MADGVLTVLHAEPLLPALWAVRMPAARTFSTTVSSTLGSVQPSLAGQLQELLITSGAMAGFGLAPFRSVGAMNHW